MILVNGATTTMARYLDGDKPRLGRLVSPRAGNSIEAIATGGRLWAADNDAFAAWDADRYWRMLGRISRVDRSRFLWVAVPDVVGTAQETVNRWCEWYPQIEALGLPAAFVGQDGLEAIPHQIPWEDMACFFVGGSTEWKLSPEAERFVIEARARGKWTHVGRVNTRKRMQHMFEIEADSIDGRCFSAWPDVWIPKGLRWLHELESQTHFLIHRQPS